MVNKFGGSANLETVVALIVHVDVLNVLRIGVDVNELLELCQFNVVYYQLIQVRVVVFLIDNGNEVQLDVDVHQSLQ